MGNIAQKTIDNIYFQLGNPDEFEDGYITNGAVMGQTVTQEDYGEVYKPTFIEYEAKVIRNGDKLEWQIVNWKRIGRN